MEFGLIILVLGYPFCSSLKVIPNMLKFMSAVLNGYSILYLSYFFLKVYLHGP